MKKNIKTKSVDVKLNATNDQYWLNIKSQITASAGTFRWQNGHN